MIANGGSYRCASWWANHLQSSENDRARVVKSYGLRSENVLDMLHEMEASAQGTRCENYFYQMNLNPRGNERLTEEQWDRVREIAEKHHGFEGQAYFVIEHVKNGRVHQHIVWSRIDLETMRAIPDSNDARRNHAIAREVESELGLEQVKGPYDREPGEPRPKRAPERWEMYRGMKTGLDPRDIEAEVTELFHQSDSGKAFQAALEQHGYMLVQGDRRGFLILDSAGKEHSLARRINDVNAKELNAFMRDVDREALPTVAEGKALYRDRRIAGLEADRATVSHEIAWEEALARAAIEKEKIERRFVESGAGRAVGERELTHRAFDEERLKVRYSFENAPAAEIQLESEAESGLREGAQRGAAIVAKAVDQTARVTGNALDFVGGSFISMFAAPLTPEQKLEAEINAQEGRADTEERLEGIQRSNDRDLALQRQEEERQAAQRRARDDRER